MAAWHAAHPTPGLLPTHQVSRVFYTVANMPADPVSYYFFSPSLFVTFPIVNTTSYYYFFSNFFLRSTL